MSTPSTTPLLPTTITAGSIATGNSVVNSSSPPLHHLNSPAAGSDPNPSTVLPSKLVTIKPPQSQTQQQQQNAASKLSQTLSQPPPPPQPTTSPQLASIGSAAPPSAPPSLRPPGLPHWFVVFYAIIKDTDGRDKALKALQYGLRYVKWAMKQSPHRTQQVVAVVLAIAQLATAHTAFGSPSKLPPQPQHATVNRAIVRLPTVAASSTTTRKAGSASDVALPFTHITVPLTLVEQLIAAITQRIDLLTSTFSVIRKGIRLFKWQSKQHNTQHSHRTRCRLGD